MAGDSDPDDLFITTPTPAEVAAESALAPTSPAPLVSRREEGTHPAPAVAVEAPPAVALTEGEEPFERAGATQIGILGGKGSGKSYLFQAMVYRTADPERAGALSYFLGDETIQVFRREPGAPTAFSLDPLRLAGDYMNWIPLDQTTLLNHRWYKLRIQYRRGFFRRRTDLEVQFYDGSGEALQANKLDPTVRELWEQAFLPARVMVFCLPAWAAFPGVGLTKADHELRARHVDGLRTVIKNFADVRDLHKRNHKVRCVLALTMADDHRSALTALRDDWITPFMKHSSNYLGVLRKGHGVARYLADARAVSEALYEEIGRSPDAGVSSIPKLLRFGAGRPWIVPVSAIEGAELERLQRPGENAEHHPVPVHVELPLLVALCDRHNALM